MDEHKDLVEILTNNFSLEVNSHEMKDGSDYLEHIQRVLATKIEFMINTDLERLLQILYRVDVDQRLTDQAFDLGEIKKVSFKLAELIIRRQLKKIEYSRKFYGNS